MERSQRPAKWSSGANRPETAVARVYLAAFRREQRGVQLSTSHIHADHFRMHLSGKMKYELIDRHSQSIFADFI